MSESKQTTNTLLLLTIINHASWSTLHIVARYLQVYAKPMVFDGQGLLSSSKGFAALFLFLIGIFNSWIESCQENTSCDGKNVVSAINNSTAGSSNAPSVSTLSSVNATLSASASCLCNSNNNSGIELDEKVDANSEKSTPNMNSPIGQSSNAQDKNYSHSKQTDNYSYQSIEHQELDYASSSTLQQQRRKKVIYTLLFAFVSTSRASSNIASSKYTYPYNITLIASLTPIIIAIFDRLLLNSPFPPLLWPTILLSSLGGFLIAISQSLDNNDGSNAGDKISTTDNLIGCSLQLLSAIFSAFARILMKRTEHILTPTQIVQTNNVSNCLFPFIYTIIYNPSSWRAFRYLIVNPKSLLAWCTMSIGVYSFASTLQIRLVRNLGPGFYSSWVAIRVLGSMILSATILGEGIDSWLEWVGIGLMIVTISVYLVETRKWMDHRKDHQQHGEDNENACSASSEEEEEVGEEELVPVKKIEEEPLLAKTTTKLRAT